MPLVFIVMGIIVALVVIKDNFKENRRIKLNESDYDRITNTTLERQLMNKYSKSESPEIASEMVADELRRRGFEPCLLPDQFEDKDCVLDQDESYISRPYEEFDSPAIKNLRDGLRFLSDNTRNHYQYRRGDEYIGWSPKDKFALAMIECWTRDVWDAYPIGTRIVSERGETIAIDDVIVDLEHHLISYKYTNLTTGERGEELMRMLHGKKFMRL